MSDKVILKLMRKRSVSIVNVSCNMMLSCFSNWACYILTLHSILPVFTLYEYVLRNPTNCKKCFKKKHLFLKYTASDVS